MLQHLLFLRPSIEGVSVTTENLIFKVIYAVTCPLFLALGVIFYTRMCFADPINCICNSTESFKVLRTIDSYCLENSFVVLNEHKGQEDLQDHQQHESILMDQFDNDDNRMYQWNYQYVGLYFVICGALCYTPYVIWEWFENGILKSILQDLMSITLKQENPKKYQAQIKNLGDIWTNNSKLLRTYAGANVFCEFLNFVVILFIFVLGSAFLQKDFIYLGFDSSKETAAIMFPKTANCTWQTVGPFGDHVSYGGVCTLNLNYLSEKMFRLAWWWLSICGTLCCENLVYRYIIYRHKNLRSSIIKGEYLSICLGSPIATEQNQFIQDGEKSVDSYLQQINYHEFFMLKRIQANVPPDTFENVLQQISSNIIKGKVPTEEE